MTKKYLALTALLVAPLSAQAITWNLKDNTNCISGCNTTSNGNTQVFSASGAPNVSASAFSTAQTSTAASQTFGAATIAMYIGNGLGATGLSGDGSLGAAPDHAFDNDGSASTTTDYGPAGAVDAGFFKFDQAVNLQSVSIGWGGSTMNYDADISVLAYTGSGTPVSIVGKTFADLLNSGWQFIGNYANLVVGTAKTINSGAGAVTSSYWLISAYTSSAGTTAGSGQGATTVSSTVLDFGNDYFKISALSGTPGTSTGGSVPEPTSLMLLASGIFGWRISRRNQLKTSTEVLSA